ncbi:MAG: glutamate--cysteine ligase [Alteromonadaceae bacterium]|nr:MAG: glutamate--cysteine ligase [Alteromonadaceae bacterium]
MFNIESMPSALSAPCNAPLLTGILRGAEREALRVNAKGELATTPHPPGLGSALMHPQITTDFSESLLEFITPPSHRIEDLFEHLESTQSYALAHMQDEFIWTNSMPCILGTDNNIPVAQYGSSHNGRMKTVYRTGLGHRYGRAMQTVSGVHYNFSLPRAFWAFLARERNAFDDLKTFTDQGYFSLIRNFRRHYWLLIYLFGASPALCSSFVKGRDHGLDQMPNSPFTLYKPYATSLRMGDLGYQSSAQESLEVNYNDPDNYIKTLCCAITRSHKEYMDIGIKDDDGQHQQLNASLLQIENEFYSAVRPKRTAHAGETALTALLNRGVEYIEVRCLDIDPFTPLGITKEQVHFLDTFLVYCALKESPMSNAEESSQILKNQKEVVNRGTDPTLTLKHYEHGNILARDWGASLMEALAPVAKMLDNANQTNAYAASLAAQKEKLLDSSKTPSAQMIRALSEGNANFSELTLESSQAHSQTLRSIVLPENLKVRLEEMAEESIAEQKALEESCEGSFDDFVADYYRQYQICKG